ncbi:MAG: hypothetical protein GXY21_06565 [Clostridiaceae bacterium]|nr:hypothetical protein [Clostridiaceae bacterium]
MASIEYGIDGYGLKVYAEEALSGRTYICHYCHEEILVRKCYDRDDYFAHKSISNRTPQQMMCPGYTGEGKIEDKVDQVYITNGGLPLYLCEYISGKYQLNAYFSPISQKSMNLLESWNSIIEITECGKKEEYYANSIKYYRLKTDAEWIKIKCRNVENIIPEVQRKWEWGIRGLNCEKDIFHSNYGGGYRVALHSNIVAGKEYLIISKYRSVPNVSGITYYQKGTIRFNNLYNIKEYNVYSMVVDKVTDQAIAYIQNKGYQLIEQSDEIIPMWPPAVIEGKELIYRRKDHTAYLYHNKRSEQQLFNIGGYGLRNIVENSKIFEVSTDNKIVLLSDYKFNCLSNEIRFMLTQTRNNFDNDNLFIPRITWKDDSGLVKQLSEDDIELLSLKKVYIDADVDFVTCIVKGVCIEKSTKRVLEGKHLGRKIIISMEPFGTTVIEDKKAVKREGESNLDIESIIKELYRCSSAMVPINRDFFEVYRFAVNNSEELFRIMKNWAVKKQMPYAAVRYLYRIKEVLKNEHY